MSKAFTGRRWLAVVLIALLMPVTPAQDSVAGDESTDASDTERLQAGDTTPKPSIQLETTSVTGSRELPKVLVIVPWKSSVAMGPGERPLASLVEEALTPVDPDVFRRQLSYYTKLEDAAAKRGDSDTTR